MYDWEHFLIHPHLDQIVTPVVLIVLLVGYLVAWGLVGYDD